MNTGTKLFLSEVEWRYIVYLIDSIQNDDLKRYVDNQISWYVIKANRYRFYEYTLKCLTVIMPVAVGVAQQYLTGDSVWKQVLILGAATVTSAAGTFLTLHEKRIIYRKTAEKLKEETARYVNRVGCYTGDGRDKELFLNLQNIVGKTVEQWESIEEKVQ